MGLEKNTISLKDLDELRVDGLDTVPVRSNTLSDQHRIAVRLAQQPSVLYKAPVRSVTEFIPEIPVLDNAEQTNTEEVESDTSI